MAPPKLPADAPILNVFQPMLIDVFPTLRAKTDRAFWPNRRARFLHLRILQKPLLAQPRLDWDPGAFAETDGALVRLFFGQQPALGQQFGRFLARDETIQPIKFRNIGAIDRAIGMKNVDDRQVVALANLEIEACRARG